jgi:RHS repeat-associated protein
MAWERSAKSWVDYLYEPGASFVPMVQLRREAEGNKWGAVRKAWYQCDHLGTPMELTDERGKIVWEGRYKAFGGATATSLDGFTNNIRFQGQYFDDESGLHYNRYRYYDPGAGRYVSKDPIALAGGMNKFSYSNQNPTRSVDPLGLDTYVVNRDLQISGNSARSRSNPITHTFTAVTNSDGSIAHTYSWGNEANLRGWSIDQPLDLNTARQAIANGLAEKVGDANLDRYVADAYNNLDKREYEHSNWILANNCKMETNNLIKFARRLQQEAWNPSFAIPLNIDFGNLLMGR